MLLSIRGTLCSFLKLVTLKLPAYKMELGSQGIQVIVRLKLKTKRSQTKGAARATSSATSIEIHVFIWEVGYVEIVLLKIGDINRF